MKLLIWSRLYNYKLPTHQNTNWLTKFKIRLGKNHFNKSRNEKFILAKMSTTKQTKKLYEEERELLFFLKIIELNKQSWPPTQIIIKKRLAFSNSIWPLFQSNVSQLWRHGKYWPRKSCPSSRVVSVNLWLTKFKISIKIYNKNISLTSWKKATINFPSPKKSPYHYQQQK